MALPNTGGLSNPGTALSDAFKAAFVYTHIVQSGDAQFSAANNYDNLLNHDVPEILANRFTLGDFQDGPNLLLTARVSEATNYPEYGANWYWDGVWKSPWPWAIYLAKTGDVAFVSKYFHDDSGGASTWGPSLYTMMHEIPGQLERPATSPRRTTTTRWAGGSSTTTPRSSVWRRTSTSRRSSETRPKPRGPTGSSRRS